ncbi:hypothetical protein H0H87_009465 [Tephrocybe sp. NHM501043]|nr:hypothetical protein H0H87_009465 [Tephrocybe sp. NHM501043]
MVNHVRIVGVPLAPNSTLEPANLSTLTPYKSSTTATRWFCGRCSSHILWEYNNTAQPSWCVAAGALERTGGIVNSTHHIWVGDTLDGGIADHLPTIDGNQLPRYAAGVTAGEILPAGWQNLPTPNQAEERLHAYCHCKANSFYITRPTAASALPTSPYPDLTHAAIRTPTKVALNCADDKWWLCPSGALNPTHYWAGHCACTSCRTCSGFEIQSWAFIPRANVLFPRPVTGELSSVELRDLKERPPGLRHYMSNDRRNREFCGTCGATVFWWGEERPDLVDVSVGLIDEKQDGARAERWFEWWKERVSFEEDALSRKLIQGLEDGLKASAN